MQPFLDQSAMKGMLQSDPTWVKDPLMVSSQNCNPPPDMSFVGFDQLPKESDVALSPTTTLQGFASVNFLSWFESNQQPPQKLTICDQLLWELHVCTIWLVSPKLPPWNTLFASQSWQWYPTGHRDTIIAPEATSRMQSGQSQQQLHVEFVCW